MTYGLRSERVAFGRLVLKALAYKSKQTLLNLLEGYLDLEFSQCRVVFVQCRFGGVLEGSGYSEIASRC